MKSSVFFLWVRHKFAGSLINSIRDVNLGKGERGGERKMRSLSSVGLGLSIVFGCLLVALLAELYYLLWCRKRFTRPGVSNDRSDPATSELLFILCCRRSLCPSPRSSCALNPSHAQEPGQGCADQFGNRNSDGVERVRGFGNVAVGPGLMPRFLFTIMEETKEDLELESEDGVSMAAESSSCLGDLFQNMESGATPYLTPLASPSLFTPPLRDSCSWKRNKLGKEGLYTFLESSVDAEFNKLVRSSPSPSASPLPRFKFMRDAEEKLYTRRT